MKICQIQLTYYPDMSRVDIYGYSRALGVLGHEVTVIVARRYNEPSSETIDNVHIIRIDTTNSTNFFNSLQFYLKTRRLIKNNHYDIIHLFNPSPAVTLLSIEGRFRGWPTIFDIRTGPIGQSSRSWVGHKLSLLGLLTARKGIIISEMLIYRIIPSFLRKKLSEVPLGVDFDLFTPQSLKLKRHQLGYSEKDIILIYTGAMNIERRLENVIKAFLITVEKIPHLRLLFIGDGTACKNLISLVNKWNLSSVVKFLSPVPHKILPQFLASADIGLAYIPLSPWFNLQPPLKTIEYLAMNLPTIATATDGNLRFMNRWPELVTNDSVKDLSQAILYVVNNLARLKTISYRQQLFSLDWKEICRTKLIPVYLELLLRTSQTT